MSFWDQVTQKNTPETKEGFWGKISPTVVPKVPTSVFTTPTPNPVPSSISSDIPQLKRLTSQPIFINKQNQPPVTDTSTLSTSFPQKPLPQDNGSTETFWDKHGKDIHKKKTLTDMINEDASIASPEYFANSVDVHDEKGNYVTTFKGPTAYEDAKKKAAEINMKNETPLEKESRELTQLQSTLDTSDKQAVDDFNKRVSAFNEKIKTAPPITTQKASVTKSGPYGELGRVFTKAYEGAKNTIEDAANRFGDFISATADPNATPADRATKLAESVVGGLNVAFIPFTSAIAGLKETKPGAEINGKKLPSLQGIASGIETLFQKVGEGSKWEIKQYLDALPISDSTKSKIEPVLTEIATLVNSVAIGKVTHTSPEIAKKTVELGKIMDAEWKAMPNKQGGFVAFGGKEEAPKTEVSKKTETEPNSLIAVHNINEPKLQFADKTGGIANPSIAIVDANKQELKGFGDISLIGPKELIEPGKMEKGKTFSADIYSPRYPRVFTNIPFSGKEGIYNSLKKYENSTGSSVNDIDLSDDPHRSLENSNLTKAAFLDSEGIKFETKYDKDGNVDDFETRRELNSKLDNPTIQNKYISFIDNIIEKADAKQQFFAGYTYSGRRRLVPTTAENASKIMNKESVQGGEGFFYGLGNVRAKAIDRFKSLAEIRKNKGKILKTEDFEKVKKQMEDEFDVIRSNLAKYAKNVDDNHFIEADHQAQAIGDYLAGDKQWFDAKFENVPDIIFKEMDSFRKRLVEMPTEYFETKYKRPVQISEFRAAIVPIGTSQKTIDILKKSGIEDIRYYDPKKEGDRLQKIRELQGKLAFKKGIITPQKLATQAKRQGVPFNLPKEDINARVEKLFNKNEVNFLFPEGKIPDTPDAWALYTSRYMGRNPLIQVVMNEGKISDLNLYHESWHAIEDNFMKPSQIKLLDDVIKNPIGKLAVQIKYRTAGYKGYEVMGEYRADLFAEWYQKKLAGETMDIPKPVDSIFTRILNTIKGWIKKLTGLSKAEKRTEPFFKKAAEKDRSNIPTQERKLEVKQAKKGRPEEYDKPLSKEEKLAEARKALEKGEKKNAALNPIEGFKNSTGQTKVGEIDGQDVVLGTFGKNSIERKTLIGKADRLPISEIKSTLPHIEKEYVAGRDNFRKDNTVNIAVMPDGEKRAIITRINADGKKEIINFFKIGRNYYNFINNLKSFGTPAGNRTQISSLEERRFNPLAYRDKESISKPKSEVKGNYVDKYVEDMKVSKEDILLREKALKEMDKLSKKESFLNSLKIKLPRDLEDKAAELIFRKEALDSNPMKKLVKYMARRGEFKGSLPEVTGAEGSKSIFKKRGDDILTEATGIDDTEKARDAFDTYMKQRKAWESDMEEYQAERKSFLKEARGRRNEIISEKRVENMTKRTEKHIGELLADENKKKEAIKRAEEAVILSRENLKKLEEQKNRYADQVKKAHEQAKSPATLWQKFKAKLSPIEATDPQTKQIYLDWETAKLNAKEEGNKTYERFKAKADNDFPSIIEYEAGKKTPWIKEAFDAAFTEAKRLGLEPYYKEDYIPHIYNEKQAQIKEAVIRYMEDQKVEKAIIDQFKDTNEIPEKIAVKLKLRPSFQRIRTFPDYKTALKYGLTPRYNTVAEHLAYYREEMLKTVSNLKLIDDLIANGKVLDAYDAPSSWIEVKFPGRLGRTYYAPRNLADALNGRFRDEDLSVSQTIWKYVAKASQIMQEVKLSAGIPGTNVNFFSIGQAIKTLTVGVGEAAKLNPKGAMTSIKAAASFIRANFNGASIKWLKKNQKYIDLMAENNVPLTHRIDDYASNYRTWKNILTTKTLADAKASLKLAGKEIVKNSELKKPFSTVGKAFVSIADSRAIGIGKDVFDKFFNEKTFTSMMPQMQIQVFKDIYEGAVKAGMPEATAAEFAAKTVKAEFGVINDLGRTQYTKDFFGSVFFAPRFREGIINTFVNAGKSFTSEFRNPAYGRSRSLVIGMILTYIAYNYINRQLNDGDNMWDNEPGHEFDLKFKLPDGRIVYTPFMPSVLSFVRNMGSSVLNFAQGRNDVALQKAGSLFSMPIKTASEIVSNQDYFGRPIYEVSDDPATKVKKAMIYMGLAVNHPYAAELYKYFDGKQDIYQTLVMMSELPLKFSTEEKAAISRHYQEIQDKSELNARERSNIKDMVDTYDRVQKLKAEGNTDAINPIIDGLSDKEYQQYQVIMKYEQIAALKKNKQTAEAKAVGDSLTDEEYLQYKAIQSIRTSQKRTDTIKKKATKPEFEDGKKVDNKTVLESVITYAHALAIDPVTAFDRIFSGQKIRRVDNNTIIVERMSLEDSQKAKKEQNSNSPYFKLDHTIPLELGGDNSPGNLKIVDTEKWASYTPVENHLAKLLRAEKITKQEAQQMILKFKDGRMSAEDILKL